MSITTMNTTKPHMGEPEPGAADRMPVPDIVRAAWPDALASVSRDASPPSASAQSLPRLLDTKRRLTKRRKRFVEEYLSEPNATYAALRAGYSPTTASSQGSRLLRCQAVADAVTTARAEREILWGTGNSPERAAYAERVALQVLHDLRAIASEALASGNYSVALKACEVELKHYAAKQGRAAGGEGATGSATATASGAAGATGAAGVPLLTPAEATEELLRAHGGDGRDGGGVGIGIGIGVGAYV